MPNFAPLPFPFPPPPVQTPVFENERHLETFHLFSGVCEDGFIVAALRRPGVRSEEQEESTLDAARQVWSRFQGQIEAGTQHYAWVIVNGQPVFVARLWVGIDGMTSEH